MNYFIFVLSIFFSHVSFQGKIDGEKIVILMEINMPSKYVMKLRRQLREKSYLLIVCFIFAEMKTVVLLVIIMITVGVMMM